MKFLVNFSRIAVGILFIVSGFIKLNDPVGFAFKLEEYFSPGVLDLPFLLPYALAISIFIVIVEVLLGVFLLLGFKRKFTLWSLMAMIVFFTFLTFYSAYFNKVTDCGCFGDAIKLTPWESFTKDVILLVLIVILFLGRNYIRPLLTDRVTKLIVVLALVFCIGFAYHVYNHLPVFDFRPYKIGANIEDGMAVPDNAPVAIFDYAWKFRVNGEEKIIVTQGEYPSVEGEFIGVETTQVQAGYEPPIHDFTIEENGTDKAGEFLQMPRLMMIVAYDLAKSSPEGFAGLEKAIEKARSSGYEVIGMSASSSAMARQVSDKYRLGIPFYFTDETTLKTIVRSNPGVLLVREGTIVDKKHFNDLDALDFEKE